MIGKHFGPPLAGAAGRQAVQWRAQGYRTITARTWDVANLAHGLEPDQLAGAPGVLEGLVVEHEPESLT